MALKDDIALLERLSIFEGLKEDHLRLLAFGAERKRIGDGHVLFREGAQADCAFVVISGSLRLTKSGPGGENVIGTAPAGSILTEIAMIAESERHFTATAIGDSEVMRISRTLFHRMLEEYPEVAVSTERRMRENFARLVGAAGALSSKFAG